MVLVRPQTILAGFGKAQPRSAIGAKGLQIYSPGGMFWSKKGLIVRNPPYTIENPHLGQIEVRMQFGEIARRHAGERGFIDGLPAVAYYIRQELSGYRAPNRLPEGQYPSATKKTFHTLEELRAMYEQKAAGARARAEAAAAAGMRRLF